MHCFEVVSRFTSVILSREHVGPSVSSLRLRELGVCYVHVFVWRESQTDTHTKQLCCTVLCGDEGSLPAELKQNEVSLSIPQASRCEGL